MVASDLLGYVVSGVDPFGDCPCTGSNRVGKTAGLTTTSDESGR